MAQQVADPLRAQAVKRLDEKRAFWTHVFTYLAVNGMLVVIWLFARTSFFWPIIPMALWGIGLVIHAYETFRVHGYTESEIEREMARLGGERVPESKPGGVS